jgi:hypothetical protein
MNRTKEFYLSTAVGMAAFLAVSMDAHAQGAAQPGAVAIDNDDIGGVVMSPNGPEAGVWVIAETHPTSLALSFR